LVYYRKLLVENGQNDCLDELDSHCYKRKIRTKIIKRKLAKQVREDLAAEHYQIPRAAPVSRSREENEYQEDEYHEESNEEGDDRSVFEDLNVEVLEESKNDDWGQSLVLAGLASHVQVECSRDEQAEDGGEARVAFLKAWVQLVSLHSHF
jgi:hypothetical protein